MKRDAFTMEPGYDPTAAPRGVAIFLCNLTMNMAAPWLAAGFRVVMVDPQHVASSEHGLVERIAGTVIDAMPRLSQIIRTEAVVFVFGFPPCTDVAVSGSRWFEAKRAIDNQFQAKAALVAEQCRMVGMAAGCAWGFENPVSVFSSIFGKPSYTFNPHDFTLLCADDNYTKKTCLWTGGGLRDAGTGARSLAWYAGQPNSRGAARTRSRQLPERYTSRFRAGSVSCQRAARDCEGGVTKYLPLSLPSSRGWYHWPKFNNPMARIPVRRNAFVNIKNLMSPSSSIVLEGDYFTNLVFPPHVMVRMPIGMSLSVGLAASDIWIGVNEVRRKFQTHNISLAFNYGRWF